ncbi:glycerol-3-phosphate acyltransferase [Litorilinea aerophila]|uniref:Glycerol-3-phosphate acyltransferase n=1 Tax=Litorilinea aerophila TaxID=1204385 RepID=A0A540V9Q4_9CHLR|nr:glycerol-3-phosphate acyltransferase [Litorilinea aerophila]MCC9078571.1 glycerol-3-phosphate acyltransferase [Litorilinea aerophila]GIV77102.1 MAG: glycerol-3-phosphate acyltransferase [Litorilinea sp.]
MIWLFAPAAALIGYLLGSIPVGLLVCRLYGVDIRQVGSGRIGGTNAWRAAGLKAAIPTIVGDAVKGAVAIGLATWLFGLLFPEPATMAPDLAIQRLMALHLAQALAGGLAVVGHNWSIFLGFKGGAGGITTAATTMALYPPVGGMVWLIGGFLIWWSRIAAIGTFAVGVSSFAIFLMLAVEDWITYWPYVLYGVIVLVAVLVALRPNRERLKEGNERVITLW